MTEKQGAGISLGSSYLPKPVEASTNLSRGLAEYLKDGETKRSVYDTINKAGVDPSTFSWNKMDDATKGLFNVEQMDYIKSNLQDGPWYKDTNLMGNVAGLASSFAQLAALPSMLENARLQNQSLKHNLSVAKEEQNRRNKNIKELNAVGSKY